jgi:predicted small lipoprotein YifL
MSAIVAALAVTAGALGGCGQRGALYMPSVPPLPQRPADLNPPPSAEAASGASSVDESTVPDTSGEPLTLAPDTELNSGASAPRAASAAN